MTVLVTGATGLLGNNLVRLLLDRGESVRVLKRPTANARSLDGLEVEIAEGDVRDIDSLRRAVSGVSQVIHSAGLVHIGWSNLAGQQEVNVVGTRNVAQAAFEVGVKLAHVSSVDAIGVGSAEQPADEMTQFELTVPCPYVITKQAAEQEVQSFIEQGLWGVIVNPGFMLGPWDWRPSSGRMLLAVAQGKGLIAPAGVNSYCDARDVAAGTLAAFERGESGRRYILGGPTLTFKEAWGIIAEETGGRPPLLTPPGPLIVNIGGWIGDLYGRITGNEPDMNSAVAAMSRLPKFYSSARAERELGYQTRSLRESARDAWAWFQQHGYA